MLGAGESYLPETGIAAAFAWAATHALQGTQEFFMPL